MTPMPLRALLDSTDPYNLWCHCARNQPWEDTAMPTEQSRGNCRPSADHHWRPTVRHTAVTTDVIVGTRPRVPRRRTFGLGEAAVVTIVALACLGAYTVLSWIIR